MSPAVIFYTRNDCFFFLVDIKAITNHHLIMNHKLISLKESVKKTFHLLNNNERLGFLLRSYLMYTIITSIIIGPILVGQTFISVLFPIKNTLQMNQVNNIENREVINNGLNAEAASRIEPAKIIIGSLVIVVVVILSLYIVLYATTFITLAQIQTFSDTAVGIRHLLKETKSKMWKLFGLGFLSWLIITIGFFLFIIPGVIFAIMFIFAPFFLIKENAGIVESLKKSKALVSGYKFNIFLKGLAVTFIFLLLMLPIFILTYSLGPIGTMLIQSFMIFLGLVIYEDLKRIKGTINTAVNTPATP